MTDSKPEALPATLELIALATATRPDWPEHQVRHALMAAHSSGWSWGRTMTTTVRMLADPRATPFDLKRLTARPTQRDTVDPDVNARGAAKARELLAARDG